MDSRNDNDPFGLSRLDDPEFEAQERARLTASDEGDVPPSQMQEKFASYVNRVVARNFRREGNKVDLKIIPQELFYAQQVTNENIDSVERTYYKRPQSDEFSGNDISAKLSINKFPNGNFSGRIYKYGEGPSFTGSQTEYVTADFTPPLYGSQEGIGFEQVSVEAKFAGKTFTAHYREGHLSSLGFSLNQDRELSSLNLPIKSIIRDGEVVYNSSNASYHAKFDSETGQISVERAVGGKVEDTMVIPHQIDGNQIFEELVPKPLLDNPQAADSGADKTWKDFSLRTVGIKWDMPPASKPTPNI